MKLVGCLDIDVIEYKDILSYLKQDSYFVCDEFYSALIKKKLKSFGKALNPLFEAIAVEKLILATVHLSD